MDNNQVGAQSMTGFARTVTEFGEGRLTIEMSSLNSRYLEVNLKGNFYDLIERECRSIIKKNFERGKIEVSVNLTKGFLPQKEGSLTQGGIKEWRDLRKRYRDFRLDFNNDELLSSLSDSVLFPLFVSRYTPERQQVKYDEEKDLILTQIEACAGALLLARLKEGTLLLTDIAARCSRLNLICETLLGVQESYRSLVEGRFRQKVLEVAHEFGSAMDEGRLSAEVCYYLERSDIAEELARIEIHLQGLRDALAGNTSGRRLEFLCQELGREFNTVGSKLKGSGESFKSYFSMILDAKLELEKIREQSLNIQ
jgi:uncharacterized protein (TIGR00255 family)